MPQQGGVTNTLLLGQSNKISTDLTNFNNFSSAAELDNLFIIAGRGLSRQVITVFWDSAEPISTCREGHHMPWGKYFAHIAVPQVQQMPGESEEEFAQMGHLPDPFLSKFRTRQDRGISFCGKAETVCLFQRTVHKSTKQLLRCNFL